MADTKPISTSRNAKLIKDITGQTFGRWTVTALSPYRSAGGSTRWLCVCECGTVRAVLSGDLINGKSVSCGCFSSDTTAKRNTTHGLSKTPEYKAWKKAKARCVNPKEARYSDYGGRGIKMSWRWMVNFTAFLDDVGPRPSPKHSLDRIDNARGYVEGNCKWSTDTEQNCNKRNNRFLTYCGKKMTLKQWATATGIPYGTIIFRANRGLSPEDILSLH